MMRKYQPLIKGLKRCYTDSLVRMGTSVWRVASFEIDKSRGEEPIVIIEIRVTGFYCYDGLEMPHACSFGLLVADFINMGVGIILAGDSALFDSFIPQQKYRIAQYL